MTKKEILNEVIRINEFLHQGIDMSFELNMLIKNLREDVENEHNRRCKDS